MNKKLRFIAALVVSCSVISSTALADDLSDAKDKSQQIVEEMENNKAEINQLEISKDSILNEISALDNELDELYSQVNELNSQISSSTEKIKELEQRATELRAELEKNRDIMDKQMRAMYKNSSASYVEILLDAKGITDFFEKLDTIAIMFSFNNDIISEYKTTQKELDTNLEESNNEKKSLEEAKLVVDNNLNTVSAKKSEKDELMSKATEDIELKESILAENQAESDQILASITAMEEKAQRPSRGGSSLQTSNNEQTSSSPVSTGGMYSVTGIRYTITSPFSDRVSPITGEDEHHNGTDIGAPYGAPVYSLMDGTVTYAGWMNGYGNCVIINHGEISTLYGHNSSLSVSVGQTVSGGQQISNVGSTGWSTGPHLHFGVIKGGQYIDSSPYYF